VNTLETDLIELNPNQELVILSFSFEMLSSRQVGRKLSNRLRQTTSDLYSAEAELSDALLKDVEREIETFRRYPIYYVDGSASVKDIEDTITYFQNTIAKDKWLIVLLDHTLLVEGNDTNDERKIIVELEKAFIRAKKIGKTSIIQLSQMNRNIESSDRVLNPSSHYPMRSDLSSSDAVFQGSDVIAVLSRPEQLGITAYGPMKLPVQNKVYLHFLKVREGKLAILEYENDLKYNNLIEVDRENKD
jgi:replicative DNA helicase